MSLGWKLFIFIIVVGSFIAHFVFLTWTSRARPSDHKASDTTTGHVWDGDLEELNKPLPRWWLFLFHGSVVFGIGYLLLYPGLGLFDGVLNWSQERRFHEEVVRAERRYGEIFSDFAQRDIIALSKDPSAMSAGFNLFNNNCAQCHGSDGRGGVGFPDLTDQAWQWGGEPEQIQLTLLNGRVGVMPPWGAALGSDEAVDQVAHHVMAISGLEHDAEQAAAGAPKFGLFCVSCHGPQGEGNPLLGAPDLTDANWLYAPTLDSVRTSIVDGRNNQMPAFGQILGEDRIKVLAAYVYSLAQDEDPAAAIIQDPAGE